MKKSKETFTITAALPYANGPIHIGHLAGVYIPADIYARYKRLTENDVAFICGSDEHGVAISLASKKASISPKELIDKYDEMIKSSFQEFGIVLSELGIMFRYLLLICGHQIQFVRITPFACGMRK